MATHPIWLLGQKFGRLTANAYCGNGQWKCSCECGKTTTVIGTKLRQGTTRSCGCLNRELTSKRGRTEAADYPAEYSSWLHARARCYQTSHLCYPQYGGRGIAVCDRWRDNFAAFLQDMGRKPSPKHSIDRINSDGPYEPGNCRWATQREQMNNVRYNLRLTLNGETRTLADWARRVSVPYDTLKSRLYAGWSVQDTLTTPVRRLKHTAA